MILRSRTACILLSLAAFGPAAGPARAQTSDTVSIGVAAPLSGASEILGRQVAAGAASAIAAGSGEARLVEADTACSADGGAAAARRFVEEGVSAAVGFLCTAALEAALPILTQAGIPAIDIGVRADRILKRREKDRTLLWRIAPGSDAEASAIARFARESWRAVPVGIVEDGSAYGRDLADNVREILERDGFRPSFVDNFRPAEEKQFALARRIEQSGVTHILIFGARPDIAIIARDTAELGLDLTIAGGEALLDEATPETPLPNDVLAIVSGFDVDWAPTESPPTDEGYAMPARVGVEVAVQAVRRAREAGRPPAEILNEETFVTSGGLIRFDAAGSADAVPFRTYRWDTNRFVALSEG